MGRIKASLAGLLLWSMSLPVMSQTQVIRRANTAATQLETAGSERLEALSIPEPSNPSVPEIPAALPSVAVPATPDDIASPRTIEFTAPTAASDPDTTVSSVSPEALARWHVRNNLCGQQTWSLQEFQLLFPAITSDMMSQVC